MDNKNENHQVQKWIIKTKIQTSIHSLLTQITTYSTHLRFSEKKYTTHHQKPPKNKTFQQTNTTQKLFSEKKSQSRPPERLNLTPRIRVPQNPKSNSTFSELRARIAIFPRFISHLQPHQR